MLAQLVPVLRAIFLAPPPPTHIHHHSHHSNQQQQGTSKPGFAGSEPQRHMLQLALDKLAQVGAGWMGSALWGTCQAPAQGRTRARLHCVAQIKKHPHTCG